jgi:hypothetical protein
MEPATMASIKICLKSEVKKEEKKQPYLNDHRLRKFGGELQGKFGELGLVKRLLVSLDTVITVSVVVFFIRINGCQVMNGKRMCRSHGNGRCMMSGRNHRR